MNRLDPKQLAAVLRVCEHDPDMVPVVVAGAIYAWNGTSDHCPAPKAGISVRDFVLNMEAIGATFELVAYTDAVFLLTSATIPSRNPLWRQRERELCDAFRPAAEGRTREVIGFLVGRGDPPREIAHPAPKAKPQEGAA
ncbi:hypothetical protein [Antarcticirhabdus aurantiaca]|uniref:Uncharacterized protein n=1 Tax=Antarcticirhabdus aurantiaca TaxID=2606717 RepID=A0ACD4NKF3_9HYPH|nr:hypothetical protein [Antarcticirhabdus aurantiaca]WAJ27402.1 hypothetical protein OXU80_21530 [Jeongeuplla avenae]